MVTEPPRGSNVEQGAQESDQFPYSDILRDIRKEYGFGPEAEVRGSEKD